MTQFHRRTTIDRQGSRVDQPTQIHTRRRSNSRLDRRPHRLTLLEQARNTERARRRSGSGPKARVSESVFEFFARDVAVHAHRTTIRALGPSLVSIRVEVTLDLTAGLGSTTAAQSRRPIIIIIGPTAGRNNRKASTCAILVQLRELVSQRVQCVIVVDRNDWRAAVENVGRRRLVDVLDFGIEVWKFGEPFESSNANSAMIQGRTRAPCPCHGVPGASEHVHLLNYQIVDTSGLQGIGDSLSREHTQHHRYRVGQGTCTAA